MNFRVRILCGGGSRKYQIRFRILNTVEISARRKKGRMERVSNSVCGLMSNAMIFIVMFKILDEEMVANGDKCINYSFE